MNIFSSTFFLLWIVGVALFYTVFRKFQWPLLLCISIALYTVSIQRFPIVLIVVSLLTYLSSVFIHRHKGKSDTTDKRLKVLKNVIVISCIVILAVGRTTSWFEVLGNSYFTLKAIGYLIDCERYEGEDYYEKNIFFYIFYLIYFPSVAQGPFNRYRDFRQQFKSDPVSFDYVRFMHGIQRFLWGAIKKLVIIPRLNDISTFAYSDIVDKSGITLLIGLIAYALYFYIDFSSYMDMMIGVSETFGIGIPENFRQPFFSTSISEFWRRWHITLGGWFKDYIMMPFIQSKAGRGLKDRFKKYGREAARNVPLVIGTLLVWVATGLWHGTGINYILWGMYYCIIIASSLILEQKYRAVKKKLKINDKVWGYKLFGIIRTCFLVLIANLILVTEQLQDIPIVLGKTVGRGFFNGTMISIENLGWIRQDAIVLCAILGLLLWVSILKERGKDVLLCIDRIILPVRWVVYYLMIFVVLYFGRYGVGYDTSNFLYTHF